MSRRPGPRGGSFQPKTMQGQLQLKGKFGFVLSETPGAPDLYIQGDSLRLATNGDRVEARVTGYSDPAKPEGIITRVIRRARNTAVGIFRRVQKAVLLMPEDGGENIRVLDLQGLSPKEGDLAVIRITEWPTLDNWAAGVLIEVLGPRAGPDADLKALLRKYELSQKFPAPVQAQAESFAQEVPETAWKGRETFFHIPVFTIDGADAKDFDDAVSLEHLPGGGWRLGVHIADVAHYVTENSPLDKEAYKRGTSVYLVNAVVPMLPFPLSDGLCSLRPDVVRLTLSCLMDLDAQGRVLSQRILESAIRSAKRFTYENVETILKGGKGENVSPAIVDVVKKMGSVARVLRGARFKRGSLDFDFPEAYIVTDEKGKAVDVRRRSRLESHRLIEEFMLLANETVATEMKRFPFLYRIHERPDASKMIKLEEALKAGGIAVPAGFHQGRPEALQKVLESVKGKLSEPMVHMMVLRSLKQAVYSPVNAGHFGLASACYTHFTSPIRRYPDLIVHRMLKDHLHQRLSPKKQGQWKEILPDVGAATSERERAAVEAEREFMDFKKVEMMQEHLGESFDGVISSVTSFGIFVQLNDIFVEGLVHVTNLGDDYYTYDERRSTLYGRRSGRLLFMGKQVRIKVAAANLVKRQLDFDLEETRPRPPRKGRRP